LRLLRPKAGIFGLFGRISLNFVAVGGVILLLSREYFFYFKIFLNFYLSRRKRCKPPFPRRSSFQSRAARAVLKSKLILAFVDADWSGGAAAVVQFFTIRSFSRTSISRHWRELRWPTLAKESTMRKFTVSFRMRILLQ